jgi:hypothetical protein
MNEFDASGDDVKRGQFYPNRNHKKCLLNLPVRVFALSSVRFIPTRNECDRTMTDQTIHSGQKADLPEPRITVAPKTSNGQANSLPADEGVTDPSSATPAVDAPPATKVASRASPYQARLGYDEDRASVYVEIVSSATGDVIQRFPAETASDELRQLTGQFAGNIADKLV